MTYPREWIITLPRVQVPDHGPLVTRRAAMTIIIDAPKVDHHGTPYRPLREDPRYQEIKEIIDDLPQEKIEKLQQKILRWKRTRRS